MYGDLGWRPLWVRALILASNYWTRVADLPPSSLPHKALALQRDLLGAGHLCWLSHIRRHLQGVSQTEHFWAVWWERGADPDFRAVTTKVQGDKTVHVPWAEDLREAFTVAADEQWRQRVRAPMSVHGTGGNKLRTYARFKAEVGKEAYLSTNMKGATRQLLCRFRMGIAPLQIELGRRHRQPDPDSRACRVCGVATEDEEHFLMTCPLYDELRATMLANIRVGLASRHKSLLRGWDRGSQARRFNTIMALQTHEEVASLATYLEKAWDLRSAYLEQQAAPIEAHAQWSLYIDSLDSDRRSSISNAEPLVGQRCREGQGMDVSVDLAVRLSLEVGGVVREVDLDSDEVVLEP